jgi:hypothetical protein
VSGAESNTKEGASHREPDRAQQELYQTLWRHAVSIDRQFKGMKDVLRLLLKEDRAKDF